MRARVLLIDAAVIFALAGCGESGSGTPGNGGSLGEGGATGNGGSTDSGGTSGGGGNAGSGGSSSSVGSSGGSSAHGGSAAGGTSQAGGAGSGGRGGAGGTTSAGGGAQASGGGPASGGVPGSGGRTSGQGGQGGASDAAITTEPDAAAPYKGPCDVIANGCAEAYGMARAMTASYKGPLFQLGLAKDKTKTLDIGQTDARTADMTTWSAFCGGTQSNCVVSKIYAQIHSGANDLQPAVWKAPWGPDCSAGGYTCAAKFTIESATGLPMLTTDAPQEYAIRTNNTENFATGINGGKKAMGLMYNGKPVPNQVYCCGVFGLTHKYDAPDTHGTDFMVALAYGWRDSGGCCIAVNCGANNKYCVGAEEEENNDLYDYGSSPVENALVVTQFDPSKNAVISFLNGTQVLSHSPPKANLNAGTAIHVGGGGDLSQPDPVRMREALVTNEVMSTSEVAALKSNVTAFFSTLKFP